ncbi:MAG: Uma2 family endonuclease [Thiotrichales bacterium]|nr:Uma2 family endonuclease [Thiotrichales bacterium]
MSQPITAPPAVEYPCSDGQPMAETEFQLIPLIEAISALRMHFADRDDVYVVGNMFLYYEEGNPRAVVAPDLFAVVGAPKHWRHTYKLWEEPKAPDFILEVTSRSTRTVDRSRKRKLYASLGVREYWMFDPTGDWLAPRLQGLGLQEGEYQPLPSVAAVDGGLLLHSEALGLDVRLEAGENLRFHDPVTGHHLLGAIEAKMRYRETQVRYEETQARYEETQAHYEETQARYEETQAHLAREIEARRAAEARLAELEERLARS